MMGQGETDPARPLLAEGRSPRRGRPTGAKVPRAAAAGTGREGVRQLRPPVARDSAPSRLPRLRSSLLHRRVLPEILALLQGTGRLPPRRVPHRLRAETALLGSAKVPPPAPSSLRGTTPPGAGRPWAGQGGHDPGQQVPGEWDPEWGGGGHTTRHPQPWERRVPPVPPARRTRPELPLPVQLPAATGTGPDGGDLAASIPRGWGGGTGTGHGPERGARHAGRSPPRHKPGTFFQQGQRKGFSAGVTHFEHRHPHSPSQGPVFKCLRFLAALETAFSPFRGSLPHHIYMYMSIPFPRAPLAQNHLQEQ